MSVARQAIVEAARSYNVAPRDIIGRRRTMRICAARFAVMYALDQRGWSSGQIGRALNRHHTTILHGLGRLAK